MNLLYKSINKSFLYNYSLFSFSTKAKKTLKIIDSQKKFEKPKFQLFPLEKKDRVKLIYKKIRHPVRLREERYI